MIPRLLLLATLLLAAAAAHAAAPRDENLRIVTLGVTSLHGGDALVEWYAPDSFASTFHVFRERTGERRTRVGRVRAEPGIESFELLVSGHLDGDVYRVRAVSIGPLSAAALPWCGST